MIRVCYAVDAGFLGGAELYVSRLALALDPGEFEVSVLVRRADGEDGLDAWARGLEAKGVRVMRSAMNLPFRPAHAAGILKAFKACSPDIVHVNMPGPYSGQTGLLVPLGRLCGARTVVTEHLPMVERLWKRAAVKRLAFRWLDLAVTMSHANAELLRVRQGVPETKIRVVYNGVEAGATRPEARTEARMGLGVDAGTMLVWFVGNLIAHKGLCDLLEALSDVAGRWHVVVAGDGTDRARAEAFAERAGVRERVTFLGRVAPERVSGMLAAGDVLALPSRMEGMPYCILEAMAASLPVVSTRVYGIPEAVIDGETGLLVEPGDRAGLARAFETLLADPGLRSRMGAAARARFESNFTIERHVAAMGAIYRELATGRAS